MPPGLMLLPILVLFIQWLVLLPFVVADIVTTCFDYIKIWLMLLPYIYICGRYYCNQADVIAYGTFCILADVIAMIVVDVKTTVLNVLADGIAKWQMEWPL